MKQLAKDSRLDSEEVLTAASRFFGPDGLGLHVTDRGDGCLTFEGGGGFVRVSAAPKDGGSLVNLDTREWEQPAIRFMAEV